MRRTFYPKIVVKSHKILSTILLFSGIYLLLRQILDYNLS